MTRDEFMKLTYGNQFSNGYTGFPVTTAGDPVSNTSGYRSGSVQVSCCPTQCETDIDRLASAIRSLSENINVLAHKEPQTLRHFFELKNGKRRVNVKVLRKWMKLKTCIVKHQSGIGRQVCNDRDGFGNIGVTDSYWNR